MHKLLRLFDHLYNRLILMRNDVQYKTFPQISGRIMIAGDGKIKLGHNVVFNSSFRSNIVGGFRSVLFTRNKNASIEIGDDTGLSNVIIVAFTSIYIGDNVNIGAGTKIFDSDFHSLNFLERSHIPQINIKSKPIIIKHRVFIGADVIIMKGITIGEEAVIGIGAVVTKDVPPGEVWAGNPARFIKKVPASELEIQKFSAP
jgi:acetyltransferase-like isoleucine patch superfamily enzyme